MTGLCGPFLHSAGPVHCGKGGASRSKLLAQTAAAERTATNLWEIYDKIGRARWLIINQIHAAESVND